MRFEQGSFQKQHVAPLKGRHDLRAKQEDQRHVKNPDDEDHNGFQGAENDIIAGVIGYVPGKELFGDFHEKRENRASGQGYGGTDFHRGDDPVNECDQNHDHQVGDDVAQADLRRHGQGKQKAVGRCRRFFREQRGHIGDQDA